jgi:hypothetical protein
MTILFHVTRLAIFLMFVALSKNLMNVYVIVRLSGSIPTRIRKRYEWELGAFCVLSVVAAVMVIVTIAADWIVA